ncbi:hypothetical protein [Lactobacillus sp. N54.MGS-719]|uniref:hypothetical protein n=1 Tax=Lactobacillus sp. N54.MGS-719 TaxID=1637512 RepID=UPI000623B0D2|nr:hypothetical protein [Lactobacillus sp. N54.MGS-719]
MNKKNNNTSSENEKRKKIESNKRPNSISANISRAIKPYIKMDKPVIKVPQEKSIFYLNGINKSALQSAREKYLKRIETTANRYRATVKPFKFGTSLENNYSQIVKATSVFQNLAEKTFGKHSENMKVAKLLMRHGWATSEFFYNDILKNNYNKSEDEILEYIETFYTENNYQRFYRVFNLVIEGFEDQNLNEGYRLLLIKIRKMIRKNFDNYDLFMNTLFSIAEYVCCYKFGILSTNGYIEKNNIKAARKKYADENGSLTEIDLMSMFGVLTRWWDKTNFKKGLEKTAFGRNSIEHGRYDPRRYKKTDFIKLIVFIFNVLMAPDPDKHN